MLFSLLGWQIAISLLFCCNLGTFEGAGREPYNVKTFLNFIHLEKDGPESILDKDLFVLL